MADLDGARPDVAFLFASRDHAPEFDRIVDAVVKGTGSKHIVGCTAESIVAGRREVEESPAISLWCAVLPGARISSFHVEFEETLDGLVCAGLPEPPDNAGQIRAVLALADPFSCPIDHLIDRLAEEFPAVPLIGGMSSGGTAPGENRLAVDGRVHTSGAAGVMLEGGPRIVSVVSQGCRPIGTTYVITRAERNMIAELGGKPALMRLEETYSALTDRDRDLIRRGLHVGVVVDEHRPRFARGDFLICNVLAADRHTGAIAVGRHVRTGQTVQFHIRDAQAADEDLRQLLGDRQSAAFDRASAALMFSCNGRGTRLFESRDHDAGVVCDVCGPIPLAGFFAQGEFGPVGGRNHIHGFTASLALFVDDPA
jgi:small ligand-binding sensory domain FIST